MTDQQPAQPRLGAIDYARQAHAERQARATQPGRPTASTITNTQLDQLYAEIERLKLLVAASSEEGHAVRMAAQYAERAIENGQRAERAEAEAQQWRKATGKAIGQLRQAEAAIERVRALAAELTERGNQRTGNERQLARRILAALDEHQEQPAADEQLVHVGWWCWRGNNHGHLTTTPCRSDNVPLHAPTEWADDMRTVIQRIEDGDDEEEQP